MTHESHSTVHPKADGAAGSGKIVFYCANGHRIVVPDTVAGQRGKCSKCGVDVLIPAPDGAVQLVPAAAAAHGATVAHSPAPPVPAAPPQSDDVFVELVDVAAERQSATGPVDLALDMPSVDAPALQSAAQVDAAVAAWPASTNPTAALVARLFQEVEHGGVIEVHIAGGSVILPEFYDARWSGGSHGLFASRAADGSVTLTAVAWDSIQKIIVRQVEGLPDGMFD